MFSYMRPSITRFHIIESESNIGPNYCKNKKRIEKTEMSVAVCVQLFFFHSSFFCMWNKKKCTRRITLFFMYFWNLYKNVKIGRGKKLSLMLNQCGTVCLGENYARSPMYMTCFLSQLMVCWKYSSSCKLLERKKTIEIILRVLSVPLFCLIELMCFVSSMHLLLYISYESDLVVK